MTPRILCTFPGRAGDLLWALPTVRAISEGAGTPVDLQIAGEFAGLLDLLRSQSYLGHVCANPHWSLTPPNEWQAPDPVGTPPGTYDQVWHLGYRGWPDRPLAQYVYEQARLLLSASYRALPPVELERPWIQVEGPGAPLDVACGFTEAHFELKYGLLTLLDTGADRTYLQLTPHGSRWVTEHVPATVAVEPCGWLDAARAIRNADLFLGDCSALHVLACALGKPVVLMEPMEARWNPIFYPYGMDGPQVTVVRGHDGQPTFDARAVRVALQQALRGSHV